MTQPKRSYADVAALCRSTPERWVLLRSGQSSANAVTRIRKGSVPDLPPGEFDARANRFERGGTVTYDVEVRYVPLESPVASVAAFTLDDIAYALSQPEVRAAVERALKGRK